MSTCGGDPNEKQLTYLLKKKKNIENQLENIRCMEEQESERYPTRRMN